ncbi:hypothetical protein SEEM0047_02373 [Salmonella enterica subsp. enterica serovar Montevideo str. MB102109-0047]|nr:hypothetical protein SEEM0047_02373 [Salmonella enterica subsp. enterica serovar Montevideo str. MB102109-0047]
MVVAGKFAAELAYYPDVESVMGEAFGQSEFNRFPYRLA